ncbi:hypothetical protein IQ276_038770 [Desmonostoc muscorum LEGE 12446]|uniref:Uncharacterized protein n=1 Tax=Desmonostoc muscorum LEGE 12446 TaxID=1828758 RepID=A0A8J7DDV6_DESMC|nr:hypothetical protein [Desmonostoc muscorum]MCF2152231.1 hypothetical protein [Desmonostoc muscorum LEGE 12446]
MEQEIQEAIGMGGAQLETETQPQPEPEPEITIYDLGKVLAANEPE